MINHLGETQSIFNTILAELRDEAIQSDSLRFRFNLRRVGMIAAYEISKTLEYEDKDVITSLGTAHVSVLKDPPVIVPILRAGLPIHEGLLDLFDQSGSAFISAYRKVGKNEKFTIKIEYISSPDLTGKVIILCDAMLATGASVTAAIKALKHYGQPAHIHIVTAISSMEGIDYIRKKLSRKNVTVWTGAIDEELTAQAYIVPGLGDAGDLAFGKKSED
jgi:uracil phosphoribosyltransferase